MADDLTNLPPELGAQFLSFLREVNGEFDVEDMRGLLQFVVEHGQDYPQLYNLFQINAEAIVENFKRTGEVPPGIKMIGITTREGDNVIGLEVLHGPILPKA